MNRRFGSTDDSGSPKSPACPRSVPSSVSGSIWSCSRSHSTSGRLQLANESTTGEPVRVPVSLDSAHDRTQPRSAGTRHDLRSLHRARPRGADPVRRVDDRRSGGAPRCARASTRQRPGHRVAPPGRLHGQGTTRGAGPVHLRRARRDGSHRAADAAPPGRRAHEHDRVLHPRGGRASGPGGLGTSPACS